MESPLQSFPILSQSSRNTTPRQILFLIVWYNKNLLFWNFFAKCQMSNTDSASRTSSSWCWGRVISLKFLEKCSNFVVIIVFETCLIKCDSKTPDLGFCLQPHNKSYWVIVIIRSIFTFIFFELTELNMKMKKYGVNVGETALQLGENGLLE